LPRRGEVMFRDRAEPTVRAAAAGASNSLRAGRGRVVARPLLIVRRAARARISFSRARTAAIYAAVRPNR